MYTKITIAVTFMGPDWWLKAAIEQLYEDGLRNMNLKFIFTKWVHFYYICFTIRIINSIPVFPAFFFRSVRPWASPWQCLTSLPTTWYPA